MGVQDWEARWELRGLRTFSHSPSTPQCRTRSGQDRLEEPKVCTRADQGYLTGSPRALGVSPRRWRVQRPGQERCWEQCPASGSCSGSVSHLWGHLTPSGPLQAPEAPPPTIPWPVPHLTGSE